LRYHKTTTLLLINHWNTASIKIIAASYSKTTKKQLQNNYKTTTKQLQNNYKTTTKQLQNDWGLEVQDENMLEAWNDKQIMDAR
jgi:hypothetical protein